MVHIETVYRLSVLFIRIIAIIFVILWAYTIIGIFKPEDGITAYTITAGILIGIILNLGFWLAAFPFKLIGKIIVSILLIISIISAWILLHMMASGNFIISILIVFFIGILSFLQFFKKERSNI